RPGEVADDLRSEPARAVEDVREEETDASQLDARSLAGLAAAESVDVSGHGSHLGDLLQIPQDLDVPDVARVKDVIGAFERGQDFGAQKAVRVRNDPDARGPHSPFTPPADSLTAAQRSERIRRRPSR